MIKESTGMGKGGKILNKELEKYLKNEEIQNALRSFGNTFWRKKQLSAILQAKGWDITEINYFFDLLRKEEGMLMATTVGYKKNLKLAQALKVKGGK